MAGSAHLKAPRGRLLALLAVVLLLHVVAVQWLAAQLQQTSQLRLLATPMFTRVLRQEAPVAGPVAPVPAAAPVRQRPTVRVAPPTAAAPPPAQPASEPVTAVAPVSPVSPVSPNESPQPTQESQVAQRESQGVPLEQQVATQEQQVAPLEPRLAEPEQQVAPPQPAASAAATAQAAASRPAPSIAATDSWPADTRLNYRLGGQFRSGELHGSAQVQWQREGERYQTRVDIDVTLLASLVLTSQGEVTPQGLFPRAYEELRRSGPRGARLGDTSIVLNDGRSVPRPEGVQDAASQFVELSHRFATGQESMEVGRSVTFWLARPSGVDLWTYDIVGRETLRTPTLGDIDAFHLKPRRITNPRGNITAEMWFAPTLQYLPVRIRVAMGDATWVDLMVEKIEQR